VIGNDLTAMPAVHDYILESMAAGGRGSASRASPGINQHKFLSVQQQKVVLRVG
jgi:hypothetical protein